ncbi:MAG: DUF2752 domain-containing protein [Crocinitomicaceae bacterium]|nr:DUF2752 domain-containing protein [Crocinitomicaceae bacterium]
MFSKQLKYYGLFFFLSTWLFFLGAFSPLNSPIYPKCPIHYVTGLDCPGCGSSRCAKEMVSMNFSTAFKHNPLAFIAIPSLLIFSLFKIFDLRVKNPSSFLEKKGAFIIFLAIVIFTIYRNLF